jgi:hypothetical protein
MSHSAGLISPEICVNNSSFCRSGGSYLGIGPDVLEHACNSAKCLVKVVAFLQRILYSLAHVSVSCALMHRVSYLQYPLIFFAMCVVRLLCCANIVLKVGNSMLPGLQSLSEELGNL